MHNDYISMAKTITKIQGNKLYLKLSVLQSCGHSTTYIFSCHACFHLPLGRLYGQWVVPWQLMDLFYIDINECSLSNGGCAQVCNNTIGSYVCSCNAGYNLENDNHTCSGYFYLFLLWIIVTQISMNVNLIMVAVLTYVSILLEVISVNAVMGISQLMITL